MGIHWSCYLIYLLSALLGFLLSWMIFGRKAKELDMAKDEAQRNKSALDKLVMEFNNHKRSTAVELDAKDGEINKLNKLNLTLSKSNLASSKTDDKELLQLKERNEILSADNLKLKGKLKAKNDNADVQDEFKNQIRLLEDKLTAAGQKIKKQDALILDAKRESFSRPNLKDIEAKNAKLKSKVKALKDELKTTLEKNKKMKKKLKSAVSESVVETFDLEKLNNLIKSGDLVSKKTKRKKIK